MRWDRFEIDYLEFGVSHLTENPLELKAGVDPTGDPDHLPALSAALGRPYTS